MPMLEGHKAPLRAAAPFGVHEGALVAVALPDLPCHFHRGVTRTLPELAALACVAGSLAAFQLAFEERVEPALEQHGRVTARHGVAQELPHPLELGVERGAGRELVAIALG